MPSVLTHYGFNKEVLNNDISFLKNNHDIYLLGAQGPDPFFFYGIIPSFKLKNSNLIRNYGSRLHKIEPSEVFAMFFKYANNNANKDVLYAYILGAGLHYILDRKIHPYVYYNTGFSDDKKKKRRYFSWHTLFETNMDVLLMDGRFASVKNKPYDAIETDDSKVKIVSEMYGKLSDKLIKSDAINNSTFFESYISMRNIEKILYSKRGIKKNITNVLFKNTPLNTMMHPLVVKDDGKIDYLNLKKREWQDPSTEEVYNKSVNELIDEAKIDVEEWIMIVERAYRGEIDLDIIKGFTQGKIYDGYASDSKMKVFKSVYEREG